MREVNSSRVTYTKFRQASQEQIVRMLMRRIITHIKSKWSSRRCLNNLSCNETCLIPVSIMRPSQTITLKQSLLSDCESDAGGLSEDKLREYCGNYFSLFIFFGQL